MVAIYNDCIIIDKKDPSFTSIRQDLTFHNYVERKIFKKDKNGKTIVKYANYSETNYVYNNFGNNAISIPRGLLFYIKPYISESEVVDMQNKSDFYNINLTKEDLNNYKSILDGIDLRIEQIVAIRKMIMCKRCIIQSATGSGKTEIMCGFLKVLKDKIGRYPTTLIIEPTILLLNGTLYRMQKYGIPVSNYRDTRSIVEGSVNICHPKSLINDLKKNPSLLNHVNVILGDEVHHMRSILFRQPMNNAVNIDYSIGLSASAINTKHVGASNLSDYDYDELSIIGSTGPLVMNITSGKLIDNGRLATPVVISMNNPADQEIPSIEINNWHRIVKDKLYSDYRTELTCKSAEFFRMKNRKIMILVNTVEWSRIIMKKLFYIDSDVCKYRVRASYGGGKFEYYDGNDFVEDNSDVFKRFSDGEFQILIGTTHMYEGADVPNLDVLILAFGGKKERMVFQGVGRVLRKTKNGKYAYIVDFTDESDVVLNSQYRKRRDMYKNVMLVPDNMYYENVEIDELEGIFNKLEE